MTLFSAWHQILLLLTYSIFSQDIDKLPRSVLHDSASVKNKIEQRRTAGSRSQNFYFFFSLSRFFKHTLPILFRCCRLFPIPRVWLSLYLLLCRHVWDLFALIVLMTVIHLFSGIKPSATRNDFLCFCISDSQPSHLLITGDFNLPDIDRNLSPALTAWPILAQYSWNATGIVSCTNMWWPRLTTDTAAH